MELDFHPVATRLSQGMVRERLEKSAESTLSEERTLDIGGSASPGGIERESAFALSSKRPFTEMGTSLGDEALLAGHPPPAASGDASVAEKFYVPLDLVGRKLATRVATAMKETFGVVVGVTKQIYAPVDVARRGLPDGAAATGVKNADSAIANNAKSPHDLADVVRHLSESAALPLVQRMSQRKSKTTDPSQSVHDRFYARRSGLTQTYAC